MEMRNLFQPLPRLAELHRNLTSLNQYADAGRKTIELKVDQWTSPIGLLPLAVLAEKKGIKITTGRNSQKVKRYLGVISFPEGISDLKWMKKTSFLPITRLNLETGDKTLTDYESLILKSIENETMRASFQNSLKYLTSEMVTNVKEHAKTDHYWILAQYWPKTETCEIAIADTGIGYLESYRGTEYEVKTHADAIENAVKGNSSKDDVERGAGIPGMINIFCEGYGGCVAIMSGNALFYKFKEEQDFFSLNTDGQGVFIGLNFKLSEINALSYLT